jgi:hypothetical protein
MRIKLFQIAHARAGDKGEITNVAVFPYNEDHYAALRDVLTPAAVKEHFGALVSGEVFRYDLPSLKGFNFVLHGTRKGGVSAALELDAHGKAYSSGLLEMEIEIEIN